MRRPTVPGDRRAGLPAWGAWAAAGIGLGLLTASCFGSVLWQGRQFAYRDTKDFYYPLHLAIQRQWDAGTVPLWEPGEDGGLPLVGSPQAAVFYPGKLIFAALPYPWAARWYVVGHVLLAGVALRAMLRSWGVSGPGATLGGLAYAFGAPILSGTGNLIYLVGSAWAPLGFRASDGWLRLGRRWSLVELAVVLMLEATGGDLEVAYLTGAFAGGYALVLGLRRRPPWAWAAGFALLMATWSVVAPAPAARPSGPVRVGVGLAWALGLLILLGRATRGRERRPVGARLAGLVAAGGLAICLGAIQLVPVGVNLAASRRWAEAGTREVERFSLEPYRILEAIYPECFGTLLAGDRFWLPALPAAGGHQVWAPSLYLGVLPVVLAVGACGFREGPPWRGWLTAVALLGFLGACGRFFDPAAWLGPRAGGSFYRLCAAALPGFGGFRYPSKVLVFVCLAVAGLAGAGWDRVVLGRARRPLVAAALILLSGLVLLVAIGSSRVEVVRLLDRSPLGRSESIFGPFDPGGAWLGLVRSLGLGVAAAALSAVALALARRSTGPGTPLASWAGGLAVLILAVDLAVNNAGLVFTLPQGEFDRPGVAAEVIRAAEAGSPTAGGDFRVFRLPAWLPDAWNGRRSPAPERLAEVARWEHDTLLPNVGLIEGLPSTFSRSGAIEPEEFEAFFAPYPQRVDERMAARLGPKAGPRVLSYPRAAFDLWGTRYFLLPEDPGDWAHADRAFLSFLEATEPIGRRPGDAPNTSRPLPTDFQIRRNRAAYPRAWVVRDFVAVDPADPQAAATLQGARRHLSRGPAAGAGPNRFAFDPHTTALIETATPGDLARWRSDRAIDPSESPRIVRNSPTVVELEVTTRAPRLLVLADRFAAGWAATVDGEPTPILKANALMRAVAVEAGTHRVVYRYAPASFRVGVALSAVSLAVLGGACLWAWRDASRGPEPPSAPSSR